MSSDHEANRGQSGERQRGPGAIFEVLGESAAMVEPGECPLDDPAFGQAFEAFGLIGTFDDFNLALRRHLGKGLLKLGPSIAPVQPSQPKLLRL